MFAIPAKNVVEMLVDNLYPRRFQNLPKNPSEGLAATFKKGCYFTTGLGIALDVELATYDGKTKNKCIQISRRTRLYVLLTGNVSVFTAVEQQYDRWLYSSDVPTDKWVNTCNHDSCWRSDGMKTISDLYFQFAEEINAEREKNGLDKVAPRMMSDHSRVLNFQHLAVEFDRVPGEDYRRQVNHVRRLDYFLDKSNVA